MRGHPRWLHGLVPGAPRACWHGLPSSQVCSVRLRARPLHALMRPTQAPGRQAAARAHAPARRSAASANARRFAPVEGADARARPARRWSACRRAATSRSPTCCPRRGAGWCSWTGRRRASSPPRPRTPPSMSVRAARRWTAGREAAAAVSGAILRRLWTGSSTVSSTCCRESLSSGMHPSRRHACAARGLDGTRSLLIGRPGCCAAGCAAWAAPRHALGGCADCTALRRAGTACSGGQ